MGEVCDPPLVRTGCGEVALQLVGGPVMVVVANGGGDHSAATGALKTRFTHQPHDRASCHRYAFAVQLPPDLPHAVDAEVVGVDAADLRLQLGVADSTAAGSAVLRRTVVLVAIFRP